MYKTKIIFKYKILRYLKIRSKDINMIEKKLIFIYFVRYTYLQ